MSEWKQIYKTITINPSDISKTDDISIAIDDAKWTMHLRLAAMIDPSFYNLLRFEIFKDFLKLLKKS